MRIAMIAPLEMRVPPPGYGGTELIVSLLTEDLVARGHEVVLFASGDSCTRAQLVPGSPAFLRGTSQDKAIYNMLNVIRCLERAGEFDIIHNHTCLEGLSTAGLVQTPYLSTLHGNLEGDLRHLFGHYRGWFNAISHSALSLLPEKDRCAGVIYNAIDVDSFPMKAGPGQDFLLYLSRISPEKGTHIAIEVARATDFGLVISGNVDAGDKTYFEEVILPQVDGLHVEYADEADYSLKRELMSKAKCLLAPVTWNEPFGLFMVEAMACGTPVIGFRMGAVQEVIRDGLTGYVVDTPAQMAAAVKLLDKLDPLDCRRWVAERFHYTRMTDDYLAAYARVLTGVAAEGLSMPALTSMSPMNGADEGVDGAVGLLT